MASRCLSRRTVLGLGAASAAAQGDDLAGIPNIDRLTEQERATYRRQLRDASGDEERTRIRDDARIQAQQRVQPRQGGGNLSRLRKPGGRGS